MSYLTQMLGLTVQNFVSAATRHGRARRADPRLRAAARPTRIGNFWVDLVRSTLYILLPLSLVLALVLVSQGVVQTFGAYAHGARCCEPTKDADGKPVTRAGRSPLGPAASQVAIKQLGTNGGGFFNVNSAHPFENPTPLSNFLEMLAILLIPAALCFTFGEMVGDTRQGWALLAAMIVMFLLFARAVPCSQQQAGNPRLAALGRRPARRRRSSRAATWRARRCASASPSSALWATATTAASNGSVNAMHDSFTPLGGLVPMWLMQLGEVVFGGVGSGLYGMLVFAIVAVFVAGLMVGRTPEYLGKKIEAYEMKMASLVILIPPLVGPAGHRDRRRRGRRAGPAIVNPGAHGFSESSTPSRRRATTTAAPSPAWARTRRSTTSPLGIAMLVGALLADRSRCSRIAGSLAAKKKVARRRRARCPRTRRCSSCCSSASC